MVISLRNASVGTKVSLAPAFALLCLILITAVQLWANRNATQSLATVHSRLMPALNQATELQRRIAAINVTVSQSLVWEGAGAKEELIAALDKKIAADFDELTKWFDARMQDPIWSEQDRVVLTQIGTVLQEFKGRAQEALDMKSAGLGSAAGFITMMEARFTALNELLDGLVKHQTELARTEVANAERVGRQSFVVTLAGLAIAMGLAVLATVWAARLIVRPLTQAAEIAKAVAAGNIETRQVVATQDATGRVVEALCEVTVSLSGAVRKIRSAAQDIGAVSEEIAQGNGHLSARTEQAAAALQHTAASIEQLTSLVRESATNAMTANELAKGAAVEAKEGEAVVEDAVSSIDSVAQQANRIKDIIAVIDGIAFQTNILSLNAAVEAARAGEQGRGFAVVAQEVRILAQRSADSAREIRDLIGTSVAQIEKGAAKVQAAGSTMRKIVDSVEKVSEMVHAISSAAADQSAGIDQINAAVSEMDRSTQQNAALVEQASSATLSLKHQSERLVEAIAVFKLSQAA